MSETTAQKQNSQVPLSNGSEGKSEKPDSGSTGDKTQSGPENTDQANDKAPDEDSGAAGKRKAPAWVKPLAIGVGILVLIFGGIYGLNYWRYSSSHPSTDDAFVSGNLVNVSPVISGTLMDLTVDEGYQVHKGQLLARLDDAGPRATLRQALANYRAALSQIPMAQRNLVWQEQSTQAAIQKAKAALASQRAKSSSAQQQAAMTTQTNQNQVLQAQNQLHVTQAQAQQAQAQVLAAEALVDNYRQAVETARAALTNYQQQVVTAQKAVQAAASRVQSAQTEADRTAKDEQRYRILYEQDAVSAQVYDNARAQANNARANLQAAQAQAEEAASQVEQARASVAQAQSQVEQARKNVAQGQAQQRAAQRAADAAAEQVKVARAGLEIARANMGQIGIQQANALSAESQTGESEADVVAARAGQEQITVRRTQIDTYRAQAQQAQAAMTNAQITLNDTNIYAPTDGTVIKKNANVGVSLTPGQSILTMSQGDTVWVTANFKETQLHDVRPGQSAEVEVDAVPKTVFKGRVLSINEATGASTSLLPPDNATGNFTKVVQRIPVRIELLPADDREDRKFARLKDIKNLRQGMSVTATIDTGSKPVETGEQPSPGSNTSDHNVQNTPGNSGAPSIPGAAPSSGATNPQLNSGPSGNAQSGGPSEAQPGSTPTSPTAAPGTGSNRTDSGAPVPNNSTLPNSGTGPLYPGGQPDNGSMSPTPNNGSGGRTNPNANIPNGGIGSSPNVPTGGTPSGGPAPPVGSGPSGSGNGGNSSPGGPSPGNGPGGGGPGGSGR